MACGIELDLSLCNNVLMYEFMLAGFQGLINIETVHCPVCEQLLSVLM